MKQLCGYVLAILWMVFGESQCKEFDTRFLHPRTTSQPTTTTTQSRATWSPWSNWSVCSATCSSGTRFRVRHCDGGTSCQGNLYQSQDCTLQRCLHKVDGAWGDWQGWASCSVTCGDGITMRTRECNNPAPQDGGSVCSGKSREVTSCSPKQCPIDGGWSNYLARPCSKTCGIGVAVYIRTCTNPSPEYNGKQCEGSPTKFAACNEGDCIIDGGWSTWSDFTDCRAVCGDGHRRRWRTCSNPLPQNGGKNCPGDFGEISDCSNGACPTDIKTCDKQKVDIILGSSIGDQPSCVNGSDVMSQVEMITSLCNAPGNDMVWKLGISVADNCEAMPLRAPIGLVHRDTKEKKYGILLDCYQEQLKFATKTCNNSITTQTIDLKTSNIDYHLLLW